MAHRPTRSLFVLALLVVAALPETGRAARPGLGFTDLMQVRKVFGPVLSDDGRFIALEARPGRGDGEVIVRATRGSAEFRIERGQSPILTTDGAWAAARVLAPFAERELAKEGEAPEPGSSLLRTADGRLWSFERVQAHGFSEDGAWYAVHFAKPEPTGEKAGDTAPGEASSAPAESTSTAIVAADSTDATGDDREAGTRLTVVRLRDQARFEFENVVRFAFDPTSAWLALVFATDDGMGNRLVLLALAEDLVATTVHAAANAVFPEVRWAEEQATLAWLQGDEAETGTVTDITLRVVSAGSGPQIGEQLLFRAQEGWEFPAANALTFSRDGARVFVGLRPAEVEAPAASAEAEPVASADVKESAAAEAFDPYDADTILEKRGVDVWHWQDPRIKTHEKASWKDREKHLYRAVAHLPEGRLVPLADAQLPEVDATHNARIALGRSNVPWLPLMTWDGDYQDVYVVDLQTGARTLVVEKTQDSTSLSPRGGFVAYFRPAGGGQWWIYDVAAAQHRSLAAPVPFADEDHDYPRTPTEYGVAGWATDDSRVLIHDKYDVWSFDTSTGDAVCLTGGRGRLERRIYRVHDLDPEVEGFAPDATLLLTGFDERRKNSSFWSVSMAATGLRDLRTGDKLFTVIAKARHADRILYTEQRYDEFPDLWVADTEFDGARRLTDVNPQLAGFDLGRAELVEWHSADGIPLQGVLIKPADYDPKQRYPVLVYFYRFFSQRLHEFNDPQINHRPSFAVYAGDGYAVFLPDIRFEIGEPGSSATRCLVPGVQKLVDLGVADPEAIALHGHSWSGYQAAHVITQTDVFACAVAGAPVSNMVSAYGGIRYGTGLARQFQYEQAQSRIGATLWERRDLYIENSPVFFADRIETPLLIQFGDADEAVPWTQGIELYLAMRRLDKPCVMLQYRDEPHHLQKYANKLDYSRRMKEFIDHFCKGSPAPAWWTEGEPYSGE